MFAKWARILQEVMVGLVKNKQVISAQVRNSSLTP